MIDLRTLLVLLAVADVILAAAVWLAGGRPLRDGLGAWSGSLLVRALACTLVAAGIPTPGAIAVGAGLLALSITLQASAILALQRRRLDAWLYGAIVAAVALPLQLLETDRAEAAIFGGWVIGSLLAGAGAVAWHSRPGHRASSRRALVASYLVAAVVFAWRGLSATWSVDALANFRLPAGWPAAQWLAVFAAALGATLSYLLLHKERAEAEIGRLSLLDPLTGAYNRRTFHETAERELSRAQRAGQPLSMVLLDIDHFRAINEKFGHVVGDEVLARFADRLRDALRQEDMLVRFGGEEFLVLLPEVAGPGAVVVAGRIRRHVAAAPIHAAGRDFHLTVSLGVSARLDEGPESVETLLDRASSALALAQERGRNRVVALSLGRSIAA